MPSELCCPRPAPVVLRLFPCSLRAVSIWGEGRNPLSAVPPRPTLSSCCLPKEMSPEEHQPCRPPGWRHGEGGQHKPPSPAFELARTMLPSRCIKGTCHPGSNLWVEPKYCPSPWWGPLVFQEAMWF